jgi:SHS family lactate transporter-like MFS transporter
MEKKIYKSMACLLSVYIYLLGKGPAKQRSVLALAKIFKMEKHSSSKPPQDEEHSIDHSSYEHHVTFSERVSIREYAVTRLASLKPPMTNVANPFTLLAMLNAQQWAFFAVSFLAWSWDSFDFFTVSLTISDLAQTFDKTTMDITWGITLVLMLRSVGSILFGIAADRYGRKWYVSRVN